MLPDTVKQAIQSSYSRFLKTKQLNPRYGQKLMIAAIARTLGAIRLDDEQKRSNDGHICVVEAGTGTGKTVAYLLAAIPAAQALGKKVVVSTATVALQEQIVFKDLPDVRQNSGLAFEYGLVKGRGRYLCLSKLDRILAESHEDLLFLYDDVSGGISPQDKTLYQSMMEQLSTNRWDGDRDSWPEELPQAAWSRVTTDHRQCTGRRCSFVRQCSFFKARDSLDDLDCIVANHDLVLADLALGGGAILPSPQDTIYIFDEAHHLPDKALSHFSAHTRVVSTSRWLGMSEGQWKGLMESLADAVHIMQIAAPVESALKTTRQLLDTVQPLLVPYMAEMDRTAPTPRYRFPQGQVPPALEEIARQLASAFGEVYRLLDKLCNEVSKLLESDHSPVPMDELEAVFPLLGSWCSRAEANQDLWKSYSDSTPDPKWPIARWISLIQYEDTVDFEVVSSPILASHTLSQHLWQVCCGAVATSATLTALGSFERFKLRAGTPADATYEVVPSPFDFASRGVLRVPKAAVDGNLVDAHTQAIVGMLPRLLNPTQGSLVLFASRRQMLDVHEQLDDELRERILMQGNESKQVLIKAHRDRVDAGQGSVLFGLASFAEGLDLPGRYCEHVIIAKIPFAVPDDPVEAAMAEWIEAQGGNAFMQIAVPDAAIKLVQACGRLLRTEDDAGVVTVLDRRLISKRYGKAILNSLPPFRLELDYD
ncbi:ATP-dependent DNA helicase DinG [Saccharophagus sp. K07]|uniref:ATP-dependent DNA helicase DinG n=1 Tax=Saccharophagus sp. K07 TaxID=2283636 RepID=UPI001651B658|nr:ATP-dependent DNA helicase DinG [Saccharophagus sp. K07]MBC6904627.1 ATP-dependent DNA helicase DinG [Saccharophagus sp. K07]